MVAFWPWHAPDGMAGCPQLSTSLRTYLVCKILQEHNEQGTGNVAGAGAQAITPQSFTDCHLNHNSDGEIVLSDELQAKLHVTSEQH